ncbi:hypothetical protein HYALB_00000539 [Hymenoscyphus albidus]|uniref:Defect at low temperature protein 1 n=1 Tax=Hymenoscyphus albidus TaxID=595503 RepID=A0A9N9QDB6_9HELO|nr:hypothetical protein HYALB_00000539 [Hymenoscyphus albidus]
MTKTVHLLFRIFYTSFFTVLNILLLALLLVTPADTIRQALVNKQLYNIFVIAGSYLLTVSLALFIYASRLYTNRTVLAAIPKTWIPVEKGEVNKHVRKMIVASLSRSAAIAWDSRPRVSLEPATVVSEPEARDSVVQAPESPSRRTGLFFRRRSAKPENPPATVLIPPPEPVWGEITHNGWASPTSPDLPNLQYTTVLLELPHLIEARAVSLAPIDPNSASEPPMPDIRAVQLLQRPASMGLRDYIGHLTTIGIIKAPSTAIEFLDAYEYARFGTRALSEHQFRELMKQFAEILRNMVALSPAALLEFDSEPESDIDDDATSTPTPVTPRSRSLRSLGSSYSALSRTESEGTIFTAPSRRVRTSGTTSSRQMEYPAASATPRSKKRTISKSPSANNFAQTRRPFTAGTGSSDESLRSVSQGSVIKLSMSNEEGSLPYTLNIPGARN